MTDTDPRPDETTARWAIVASDLGRLDELSSLDPLVGTFQDTDENGGPVGDLHRVFVFRDGTVTNQNADGTMGVHPAIRDLLSDEDTLCHEAEDGSIEETDAWLSVVTSPDGSFVRAFDPLELERLTRELASGAPAP